MYYYDLDDFVSPLAMRTRALNVDRIHSLDVVQYQRITVKEPPGRGNVVVTVPATGNTGLITGWGTDYSLLIVGRMKLRYDDGKSSYRYWRAPVSFDWLSAGLFNAYAKARMASYINNQRAVSGFPPARNLTGGACIGGSVPDMSSGWQLRHGTERRERTY